MEFIVSLPTSCLKAIHTLVWLLVMLFQHKKFLLFLTACIYQVGPIPIEDGIGKEVATQITSSIKNNKTFYTDSNGRDFIKRVCNICNTFQIMKSDSFGSWIPDMLYWCINKLYLSSSCYQKQKQTIFTGSHELAGNKIFYLEVVLYWYWVRDIWLDVFLGISWFDQKINHGGVFFFGKIDELISKEKNVPERRLYKNLILWVDVYFWNVILPKSRIFFYTRHKWVSFMKKT